MEKSIKQQDFFARKSEKVAIDLLGKFIYCKGDKEKYLICETEAYHHDEVFCYGHGKTKDAAKHLVCAPLFESPGTWCIYGGQLLLSVTDGGFSDNVLIKKVKSKSGEILGPNKLACRLHLYKSKSNYCGCHNQYSMSEDSALYLVDGKSQKYTSSKRVNINDDKKLNFKIVGE